MTEDFFTGILEDAGLEVLLPDREDGERVHRIIFDELCLGLLREESREYLRGLILQLKARGAEAVILGCTELDLLLSPEDSPLPCFDTTRIHAEYAARLALADPEVELVPAFDHPEEVGALFQEYTDMLIEGDPGFRQYLDIQNYEDELRHLDHKYGPPGGRLYLAYCDGRLAGCIGLRKLSEESCEMKRLYTRPAFRGLGIGRLLVQRILDDAREIGYRHMLLDTLPFLETAIAMYRRLGFFEIPSYNDSPMDTSIYMQLDL
ncbi:MAG: GNAT family N-acetyltransferase [Oscillospiraceae bacterium]|nr:GNAT family N-acetyltransferase [Oscillospiraceae bacterium]